MYVPNPVVPLSVAVLTTSYPLEECSPSGIFVARLMEAMPSGVAVTIITPASTRVGSPLIRKGIRILPVRYAPRAMQLLAHEPGGLPVALRQSPILYAILPLLIVCLVLKTLQSCRYARVLHANWAVNGCIAGIVGGLTGRPVLISLRGEDVSRARVRLGARLTLALALRLSRRIVAVSHDMAAWLCENFPWAAGRISVIENGVAPAFLTIGAARSSRTLSSPLIVSVGSLIPRKGHSVLIAALARCSDLPWRLRLVGDGSSRKSLVEQAKLLGILERVDFAGAQGPECIPKHLAEASLFAFPSLAEGRPNALLEAMAAGLPIVASEIDGVTELMTTRVTGLLIPPRDDAALATALRTLLTDTAEASRLGVAAHAHIEALGLTWSAAAQRYTQFYRALVEN